jgi:hypothetical protein
MEDMSVSKSSDVSDMATTCDDGSNADSLHSTVPDWLFDAPEPLASEMGILR